jgi:hypothetical protein
MLLQQSICWLGPRSVEGLHLSRQVSRSRRGYLGQQRDQLNRKLSMQRRLNPLAVISRLCGVDEILWEIAARWSL